MLAKSVDKKWGSPHPKLEGKISKNSNTNESAPYSLIFRRV